MHGAEAVVRQPGKLEAPCGIDHGMPCPSYPFPKVQGQVSQLTCSVGYGRGGVGMKSRKRTLLME